MKILNEKEKKVVDMELELDISDIKILVAYYNEMCSKDVQDNHKVNWSLNDLLMKKIEEN